MSATTDWWIVIGFLLVWFNYNKAGLDAWRQAAARETERRFGKEQDGDQQYY